MKALRRMFLFRADTERQFWVSLHETICKMVLQLGVGFAAIVVVVIRVFLAAWRDGSSFFLFFC